MKQRCKWLALVCAALMGCSGADSSGTSNGRGNAPAAGGRVTATTPAMGGAAGTFGNTGTTAPPTPVMMQPQQQKPAPVAGGIQPISIDDCGANNKAGISAGDASKLMAGGAAGSLRWLYPYDGTVFPRGMLAPLLMWDGGSADYVYLHIKASAFEYKGCLVPTADGQLQLDQDLWTKAGQQTKGPSDPFSVELSVMKGGSVTGPVMEHVTIAQATIKGSIYYNSYNSMLGGSSAQMNPIGGMMGGGGKVLRIPPGGMAEVFESMDCNGCHSVSANGSRLISQVIPGTANAYALAPDTPPNPPAMPTNTLGAFGALYPDGSVYLEMSTVIDVGRTTLAAMGGFGGSTDAVLYKTDDGSVVASTGIPGGSLMPMFSPDGSKLVVNDYAINQAHGLALMDFDGATHAATNYRQLFVDTDMRPGWPFVLPDNGGVVFTRTDGDNFSGDGLGVDVGTTTGPSSDISIVDVPSGTATLLAQAMGYATPDAAKAGMTYLPFGNEELHHNYFPTVSPVAAGGYFWLFFDSWRHYGNRGLQRALWGAAIDIAPDGTYALDRSHPPFYLPGQEFGTGNHRAFAALDPCKMDSDSCTSGTDCCGGYCYVTMPDDEFGEAVGSCTAHVPMCAHTNERCANSADCCAPAAGQTPNMCIAGFCAVLQPPI